MSGSVWRSRLVVPVSPERDHILGPADAPVSLVEYGDYECPFCAAANEVVKAILAQVGDAVQYVFRHSPMTTLHIHAQMAAEAAEAAGSQHKFWAMHDTLFANQQALDGPSLLTYAAEIGLDVDQFTREVAAHVHLPKVTEDFTGGVRSGVNGTPTFFINGHRHDGGWDYASLLAGLQRAALAGAAA
jgi:protein-disulfide isomerase